MPDLLASTSLLPLTPAITQRAPVAAPAAVDFMAVLGELVLPPGAKVQGGKGQAIAGGGKDLPVEGDAGADAEDADDPVIAWLPAGLVPLAPVEPAPLPDVALAAPPQGGGIVAVAAPLADPAVTVALPAASEISVAEPAAVQPGTEPLVAGAAPADPPAAPAPADGEVVLPQTAAAPADPGG